MNADRDWRTRFRVRPPEPTLHQEVPRAMSHMPEGLPKHPIGTFAFVGLYVVLFVAGWFAVYTYLYLGRGGVTP
jgi:hypothetical protein